MDKTKWLILITLFSILLLTVSAVPFRFAQTHKIVREVECFSCHNQEYKDVFNGTHISRMTTNQTRFADDYYLKYAYGFKSLNWTRELCYSCHISSQQYDKFALTDPYIFYNLTSNQSEAVYGHTDYWAWGSYLTNITGSMNNTVEISVLALDVQPVNSSINTTIRAALANFYNHQTGQVLFENSKSINSSEEAILTTSQIYPDYFNVTVAMSGQFERATVQITINGTDKPVVPILIDITGTGEHKFPESLGDYGYPYFHTRDVYIYRRLDGLWLDFRSNRVANISAYEGITTNNETGLYNSSSCSSEKVMCHINQKITYLASRDGLPDVDYSSSFYKHSMPYTTTEQCRICHLTDWVK